MVSSILGPTVEATTSPYFYGSYFPSPITYGGFSSFDYYPYVPPLLPSLSWYVPSLWGFRSPLSFWGDEHYEADKRYAGALLGGWGRTLIEMDPWFFHYFGWPLITSWMYPSYPFGIPPLGIQQPFNFLTPPAEQNIAAPTRPQPQPQPQQAYAPADYSPPPLVEREQEGNESRVENGGVVQTQNGRGRRRVREPRMKGFNTEVGQVVYDENQLHYIRLENLPSEWHQSVVALLQQQGGTLVGIKSKSGVFWVAPQGEEVFKLTQSGNQLRMSPAGSFRSNKLYLNEYLSQ